MNKIGCIDVATLEATAFDTGTLRLTVPGLPVDGSLGLAFITLTSTLATYSGTNVTQRLAYFQGVNSLGNGVSINVIGDGPYSAKLPLGWFFL